MRSLSISKLQAKGGFLTLSDGERHLILADHQIILAAWLVGRVALVSSSDQARDG